MKPNLTKQKCIYKLIQRSMALEDQVKRLATSPGVSNNSPLSNQIILSIQSIYKEFINPKIPQSKTSSALDMLEQIRKELTKQKLKQSEDIFQPLPVLIQSINSIELVSNPMSRQASFGDGVTTSTLNEHYQGQIVLLKEEIKRLHEQCMNYQSEIKKIQERVKEEMESKQLLSNEIEFLKEQIEKLNLESLKVIPVSDAFSETQEPIQQPKQQSIKVDVIIETDPIQNQESEILIKQKSDSVELLQKLLVQAEEESYQKIYKLEVSNKKLHEEVEKLTKKLNALENAPGAGVAIKNNIQTKQNIMKAIQQCQNRFATQYNSLRYQKDSELRAKKQTNIINLIFQLSIKIEGLLNK